MSPNRLLRNIFLFVGLVLVLTAGYLVFLFACRGEWCFLFEWQRVRATHSFGECAARGFPIEESFPRRCRAGDKVFTE
jgi:hypothetical protein